MKSPCSNMIELSITMANGDVLVVRLPVETCTKIGFLISQAERWHGRSEQFVSPAGNVLSDMATVGESGLRSGDAIIAVMGFRKRIWCTHEAFFGAVGKYEDRRVGRP